MNRRKKTLNALIGIFFAVVLILTFLSNTIESMSLPKVAVDEPDRGDLDLTVEGDGFLVPAQKTPLYVLGDWTVTGLSKSKGERVKKGDVIATFDTSATKRQLQDEEARYEQQRLQLDKMSDQLRAALRVDDSAAADNVSRDIEVHRLDMEIQQRKIADLKRQIDEGSALRAPMDGIITAVNVAEGATAGRGQPIAEIADDASGYEFAFTADRNDASALRIGEPVKVTIMETPRRRVDGILSDIEDDSGGTGTDTGGGSSGSEGKKITVEVKGADLEPGLNVSVSITHNGAGMGMQVPKSALKSDNQGSYVYTVAEKEGPLGTAYYVQKTYVTVTDESMDTAVVDGMMPDERFVTESTEPLSDGDRVRLN